MSAHSIVPEKVSHPGETLGLSPGLIVTSRNAPATSRKDESLLGVLGLVVIVAIFGLAAYFGLRYLL